MYQFIYKTPVISDTDLPRSFLFLIYFRYLLLCHLLYNLFTKCKLMRLFATNTLARLTVITWQRQDDVAWESQNLNIVEQVLEAHQMHNKGKQPTVMRKRPFTVPSSQSCVCWYVYMSSNFYSLYCLSNNQTIRSQHVDCCEMYEYSMRGKLFQSYTVYFFHICVCVHRHRTYIYS